MHLLPDIGTKNWNIPIIVVQLLRAMSSEANSTSPSEANSTSLSKMGSASTSDTTVSTPINIAETENVRKCRQLWWRTGNFHPKANWNEAILPYELMTGVTLDEYILQTDKHNVKGFWEWENGTVHVIELPLGSHEGPLRAIERRFSVALESVADTPADIKFCGATTSRTRGGGKEPDASFRPYGKPQVPRDGYDGMNMPWPNLVIEVAYSQEEWAIKKRIEKYWLLPNRVHDAIVIKMDYPPVNQVPSVMTAWHYCVNNRTDAGALTPVMYEFGTINREGNPIQIRRGQCVICIRLECLYYGMSDDFVIPSPPLPNPILIDLFTAGLINRDNIIFLGTMYYAFCINIEPRLKEIGELWVVSEKTWKEICASIEKKEDPRKYREFLSDRERLVGEELLRRGIIKSGLSTTWLDDLMKELEKTYKFLTRHNA
ncbi:hypothetical protein Glove_139g274 [Diversispora epigaea]|uniref:Restriction endonuclease domain-containing protein n=1 Tax=Diversispora epigaea TaxID=1348612 RepID=A0A397IVW9_9GLOM|nr:hypothetical protein Glove_139g274 [Diversispora epigaea]